MWPAAADINSTRSVRLSIRSAVDPQSVTPALVWMPAQCTKYWGRGRRWYASIRILPPDACTMRESRTQAGPVTSPARATMIFSWATILVLCLLSKAMMSPICGCRASAKRSSPITAIAAMRPTNTTAVAIVRRCLGQSFSVTAIANAPFDTNLHLPVAAPFWILCLVNTRGASQ